MKINKINELFEEICSHGITPNEYFALARILKDRPLQERMNYDRYRKYLVINDWLDIRNNPTEKVKRSKIFDDFEDETFGKNVETYRSMWPLVTLPSGKTARSSSVDLKSRFKWFLGHYNYDWSTILKATENYIVYYRDRSWAFMRTSAYFIYKEENTKVRTSTLSEWCDKILEGVQEEESYRIDV